MWRGEWEKWGVTYGKNVFETRLPVPFIEKRIHNYASAQGVIGTQERG